MHVFDSFWLFSSGTLFLIIFQISKQYKKMYPYKENAFFLTHFDCFPRKGTLFFQFFRFQNSKKGVPLRGKCMFLTHFDCFRRKGTLFLLSWKIVKKVYPYVENACFWLILIVFLVRVQFFLLFQICTIVKKGVPLRGKCMFLTHFDCFPPKVFFFIFQICTIAKKVNRYEENACFWLILPVFLVRAHFFYH